MKNEETISSLPQGQISKLFFVPQLSQEIKQELMGTGELIPLTKGSLLFQQGDPADHFYLILTGGFKLTKRQAPEATDERTLIDILGPGDLLGAALMLETSTLRPYPVTAQALGPTEVLKLSKIQFQTEWKKNPDLLEYANRAILKRIENMQKDRCMQRFSLEQKIAYFMTEKWVSATGIRITRQDIADCIGASHEAVIRLLCDWSRKNLITNVNHEIMLQDPEKIRALWQSGS